MSYVYFRTHSNRALAYCICKFALYGIGKQQRTVYRHQGAPFLLRYLFLALQRQVVVFYRNCLHILLLLHKFAPCFYNILYNIYYNLCLQLQM